MPSYTFKMWILSEQKWSETWHTMEAASFNETIQKYHSTFSTDSSFAVCLSDYPDCKVAGEEVSFMRFQDAEHPEQQIISRLFLQRIKRRGGVRRPGYPLTLEDIAKRLAVSPDMLAPGAWEDEAEGWE